MITWSHFWHIKSYPGQVPLLRHESRNKGMKQSWKKSHACRGNRTRSSRFKIQCSNHWAKEWTPWHSCQRLNIYLEAMHNLPRQILEGKLGVLGRNNTLLFYLDKTKGICKCRQVFVSYVSYKSVCTKTVAWWLNEVLSNSGIDTAVFKAHSFRGAAASATIYRGCSLQQILKTGDWKSVKNFTKIYLHSESHMSNTQGSFVNAALS